MAMTNKSYPSLCLRRGILFPIVTLSAQIEFEQRSFVIACSGEDFEAQFVVGQWTWMWSLGQWLFMEFETRDVWEDYKAVHGVTSLMSLLAGSLYFDTTLMGPQVYPGGMTHNRTDVIIPTTFEGLEILDGRGLIEPFIVSNDQFADIVNRVDNLSSDDKGHVMSSASLMRDAKILLYRGEDSAAVTAAVSAVEAMYLRPNTDGIFRNADPRIPLANGNKKAESFKRIFCEDPTVEALYRNLDPYTIRSGHLHAGRIRFAHGDPGNRSEDDQLVVFLLRCQAAILTMIALLA